MATPPIIKIDELIAPIPGDSPAGQEFPFDVRQKLDEDRMEVDNPQRPEDAKKADWPAIVKLAQETLKTKSKHFRPAARLTEALVKLHGFAGLRDGVQLMRRMAETCWDRMQPPLTEEDAKELRVADFNWLDDPDHGGRFPNTVRMVRVFGASAQKLEFSLYDMQRSQQGLKDVPPWADFQQKVIKVTAPEVCRNAADDLAASLQELNLLAQALRPKLEALAPAMGGLRQVVEANLTLLRQLIKEYGWELAPPPEPAKPGGDGQAAAKTDAPGKPKAVASREDAYRQLKEASDLLKRIEPHSPIPYLIDRCVALGNMPFPQMIKELVIEANALKDLNRMMGIPEPAAQKK
jgi:type VI secretion system protein ImpA